MHVHCRGIYVAIPGLQSSKYCIFLRTFILPGSKTNGWNFSPSVQFELRISRRHGEDSRYLGGTEKKKEELSKLLVDRKR